MRRYRRTRTVKGRFKADNKKTKLNEAWVRGSSPNWIKKRWKKFMEWFFKGFYG